MAETAKARNRRLRENWFATFAPENQPGLDIGCQFDPLNHTFRRWNANSNDGDPTYMGDIPDNTFQTVYSSHILEHLPDPVTALWNWYRICRPGGHLIILVPHRDLYERKRELPSRWNIEHRSFFLPDQDEPPHTISLQRILAEAIEQPEIIETRVCRDDWIELPENQHPCGEYSIECIVRKKHHNSAAPACVKAIDIPFQPRGPLLIVASGPSSNHVNRYQSLGAVATINEVMRIIPGEVDWLIAQDVEALQNIRREWNRVKQFLVPDRLYLNAAQSPVGPQCIPQFPLHRNISFPLKPWSLSPDESGLVDDDTRLAHSYAPTVALHVFARMGYSPIFLLGLDGGYGYGAQYASQTINTDQQRDFREVRRRLEIVANSVTAKFGTVVKFWPDFPD